MANQSRNSDTQNLLQAYPESRLVCISTIASTPTFEGNQESETASGIVRGHLVQLMEWAKPLKLPPERISYHVLEVNRCQFSTTTSESNSILNHCM